MIYMDVMLALALLSGGVMVTLVFFRNEAREVRSTHERLSALMIAESEIERLRATPFEAIQVGPDLPVAPNVPAAERMKEFSETLTVVKTEDGMKQATVRVEWDSSKGQRRHVELAGWISGEVTP
jgi:Tfp pilus assembly protein PilV